MKSLDNIKLVAFDFDDTLCIHTEHKWNALMEEDYISRIIRNEEFSYGGQKNIQMQELINECKDLGIELVLLSHTECAKGAALKVQWVKNNYGVEMENLCVGQREKKLYYLKEYARMRHITYSEAMLLDDHPCTVSEFANAGFMVATPMEVVNYVNADNADFTIEQTHDADDKNCNNVKKLFISQPMVGKSREEIMAEREEAVAAAENLLNEKVQIIDSIISSAPKDATPLWYLGKSLELLSTADIAYFTKGWYDARGCRIEHDCARPTGFQYWNSRRENNMNLLEHYIKEVHSVVDITDEFTKQCGYIPKEAFLEVDLTYNCYGVEKREKVSFWKSNFENAKEAGYFLA